MSTSSSLVKTLLIVALKIWYFDFCSGLQSGYPVSSEFQGASEYISFPELIHDENHFPMKGFQHNSEKIVDSLENSNIRESHQSYDGLDRNTRPSNAKSNSICTSEPNNLTQKISELNQHISYSPETASLQHGVQFPPAEFSNMAEDTHESSPQCSLSTQTADIFDHRQYIDEYLQYFETKITNDVSESDPLHLKEAIWKTPDQTPEGNMITKSSESLLPSQHQYTTACHIIDQEPPSLGNHCLEGEIPAIRTIQPLPTDLNKLDNSSNYITLNHMAGGTVGLWNEPIEYGQEESISSQNSVVEPVSHLLVGPKSKKMKRKSTKTSKTKNNYKFSKLDKKGDSNSGFADRLDATDHSYRQKSSHPIKTFGWDSIGHRVLEQNQISPRSEDCFSEIRINDYSKRKLLVLQRLGVINTNRSPKLCHEIYDFFREIYQSFEDRNEFSDGESEAVRLSIKNAGHGVTMTFLGIIRVFEADQNGIHDIEDLLCDGWSFIQDFYSDWKTAKHEHFVFGTTVQFNPDLSYDPYFHLRYLKKINKSAHVPLSLAHSISLLWSKHRGQSKIPKDLFKDWEQVENVSKIDSLSPQGGLYGRLNIRNMAFWGPEEFTRRHWYINGGENINSKELWSWASDAAQLHTSVGREACKDLHNFFEDLIQKLHMLYNLNLKKVDDLYNFSAEESHLFNESHSENLARIVRAVSLAEYRVIVPFLGIVRILNEDKLTSDQLQRLLNNAIEFLKETFSKWNQIDFHPQNFHELFHHNQVSKKFHSALGGLESPVTMFKRLASLPDQHHSPSPMILNLLKLWHQSITTSRLISENHPQFPIADIPSVYYHVLQNHFAKLLANFYSKSSRNIQSNVQSSKIINSSAIHRLMRETFTIKGSE
ncbi:hypothetical protein DFH28DRAFT_352020 [Melampsora americana]|nr:hypothetical protein DFH28DRAFT_352020 [Melampsora americana]